MDIPDAGADKHPGQTGSSRQTNKVPDGKSDGKSDGRTDSGVDKRMEGWKDRRMDKAAEAGVPLTQCMYCEFVTDITMSFVVIGLLLSKYLVQPIVKTSPCCTSKFHKPGSTKSGDWKNGSLGIGQ
jgi:hypothetical protein